MKKQDQLKNEIAGINRRLAELKSQLSAIESGRVSVSYGHLTDQPLGVIEAESAGDIDIADALATHLNQRKRYNMVGAVKVWVNDDIETVREFFVTEVRELRVCPF
jgi:hypothetical protein